MHSARYNGVAAQSILDRYAMAALTAQSWFTSDVASYWAFTLRNNATDGSQLWVYDARARSSADPYPPGTGNPGGPPGPIVGPTYPPSNFSPWNYENVSQAGVIPGLLVEVTPNTGIAAGDLIIAVMFADGAIPYSKLTPPDASWVFATGQNGGADVPTMAAWLHLGIDSEPGLWPFTQSVTPSNMAVSCARFIGNSNPPSLDAFAVTFSLLHSFDIPAPEVTLGTPGDLIYCAWYGFPHSNTITQADGFTHISDDYPGGIQGADGYMIVPNTGTVGPFIGHDNGGNPYGAVTLAIKVLGTSIAPVQSAQRPINQLQAVLPGLYTVNYGAAPLPLTGLVQWLPPACSYDWAREAPIAVVQPATSFSLAGISPEKAAWSSITWIAIGQT